MARKSKKSFKIIWVVLLILVAGAVGGVTYYMNQRFCPSSSDLSIDKPALVKRNNEAVAVEQKEIVLYLPETDNSQFYLVPVVRKTSIGGDRIDVAINMLIALQNEGGEAGRLIPKGTKLLSPVKIKGDTAIVNFSEDLVNNFAGGSTQEALLVNAIAYTLVNNSEGKVRKVQIMIEGEKAETIGGHFELTDPVTPDAAMLKPGS